MSLNVLVMDCGNCCLRNTGVENFPRITQAFVNHCNS